MNSKFSAKKCQASLFIFSLLSVLLAFSTAKAAFFSAIVDDDPSSSGGNLTGLISGDILDIKVDENRSYCCTANSSNQFFAPPNMSTTYQVAAFTLTAADRGLQSPYLGTTFQRLCFTPPEGVGSGALASITFSFFGTALNARVRCTETSLYGGFNTSVTDFNFLEIRNLASSGTIIGRVLARNTVSGGTIVFDQPFSVAAGQRVDLNIHGTVGAGAFGPIVITHDGAPGAINAVLNQYNITSTSPLDFEPVSQEIFVTRAQLVGR